MEPYWRRKCFETIPSCCSPMRIVLNNLRMGHLKIDKVKYDLHWIVSFSITLRPTENLLKRVKNEHWTFMSNVIKSPHTSTKHYDFTIRNSLKIQYNFLITRDPRPINMKNNTHKDYTTQPMKLPTGTMRYLFRIFQSLAKKYCWVASKYKKQFVRCRYLYLASTVAQRQWK